MFRGRKVLAKLIEEDKTVYDFAQETGISYVTMMRVLRQKGANPSYDIMERIIHNSGFTPNDLIDMSSIKPVKVLRGTKKRPIKPLDS